MWLPLRLCIQRVCKDATPRTLSVIWPRRGVVLGRGQQRRSRHGDDLNRAAVFCSAVSEKQNPRSGLGNYLYSSCTSTKVLYVLYVYRCVLWGTSTWAIHSPPHRPFMLSIRTHYPLCTSTTHYQPGGHRRGYDWRTWTGVPTHDTYSTTVRGLDYRMIAESTGLVSSQRKITITTLGHRSSASNRMCHTLWWRSGVEVCRKQMSRTISWRYARALRLFDYVRSPGAHCDTDA